MAPFRIFDPHLTEIIPLTPTALPELVTVDCEKCQGLGWLEDADPLLNGRSCPECYASGQKEICSACRQVPDVIGGVDTCGCSGALCEACGQRQAQRDALCGPCILQAYRKVIEEEDPNLKRYEELKCRDLTPHEQAHQITLGKEFGWL